MPYAKRRLTYRRRHAKKPSYLATRPRMMSTALRRKRVQQVSTKVFYFKTNGLIDPSAVGSYQFNFATQDLTGVAPPAQLDNVFQMYDEYKLLGMSIKLFPANVGTEPNMFGPGIQTLNRGDCVLWTDQAPPFQNPATIGEIINTASCRMINPRRPQRRSLYRPKGHPHWGRTQQPPASNEDEWSGVISVAGFHTTPAPPPPLAAPTLWYYTRTYKVLFRGRVQT